MRRDGIPGRRSLIVTPIIRESRVGSEQVVRGSVFEVLLRSAEQLAERGMPEDALSIIDRLHHEDSDNPAVLRVRGMVFFQIEDWEKALSDFDRVTCHWPTCATCFFERGTVHMHRGDTRKALRDFSRCLSLDPTHAPALASRAAIMVHERRYDSALKDITLAASNRPPNDRDLHNRAVVLTHLRRYREAVLSYEEALKLNPRSGGSHNNLAWLLATCEDPRIRDGSRAVQHARRAVALGDNHAWMGTLSAAHAECGNFEAAVYAAEAAYQKSGRADEAYLDRIEHYRRGISYRAWLEMRRRDENL